MERSIAGGLIRLYRAAKEARPSVGWGCGQQRQRARTAENLSRRLPVFRIGALRAHWWPNTRLLLRDLAARHPLQGWRWMCLQASPAIAGRGLNERLPRFDLTLALGAWKFAHWRLPGAR